jgi:hypothetical protein
MAVAVSTVAAVFVAAVSEVVRSVGPASGEAAFTAEGSVVVTAISIQCEAASSLAAELVHGGDETGAAIGVVTIIDSPMTLSS